MGVMDFCRRDMRQYLHKGAERSSFERLGISRGTTSRPGGRPVRDSQKSSKKERVHTLLNLFEAVGMVGLVGRHQYFAEIR